MFLNGRDSNILPLMGARDRNKKTCPLQSMFSVAGRAGFEFHPLNGGKRPENKTHPRTECVLVAGRAGFEPATGFKAGTHLAGEPIQPLWHLPKQRTMICFSICECNCNRKSSIVNTCTCCKRRRPKSSGGGSGIRTHVGFHQTCFQDMRLQPLGHPSSAHYFRRVRFYHKR